MRKFEIPKMSIQEFGNEEIIKASNCFEIFACEDCYCTSVTCDSGYVCEGLRCSTLDSI